MVGVVSRLRDYDQVVGYKKVVGRYKFYSPDFYWWTGKVIAFTREEPASWLTNNYGLPVFENDVVQITESGRLRCYHIQMCDKETAVLVDLISGQSRELLNSGERLHCKALFAGFSEQKQNYSILRQYVDVDGLLS